MERLKPNEVAGTRELSPLEREFLKRHGHNMTPRRRGEPEEPATFPTVGPKPEERNDFEVPEGTMPVLMQVGNGPITCIGWAATGADVPELLHSVADVLADIEKERSDAEKE